MVAEARQPEPIPRSEYVWFILIQALVPITIFAVIVMNGVADHTIWRAVAALPPAALFLLLYWRLSSGKLMLVLSKWAGVTWSNCSYFATTVVLLCLDVFGDPVPTGWQTSGVIFMYIVLLPYVMIVTLVIAIARFRRYPIDAAVTLLLLVSSGFALLAPTTWYRT